MSKKIIDKNEKLFRIQESESQFSRARSITAGTAFGGSIEIGMRANDGSHLWCILQPVEVIEFIHQLSALAGCHIHLQPRNDFSSWRDWRDPESGSNKISLFNWPPFSNHPPFEEKIANGQVLPPPEKQPGLKIENKENESVIVKKTVKRRNTKQNVISN